MFLHNKHTRLWVILRHFSRKFCIPDDILNILARFYGPGEQFLPSLQYLITGLNNEICSSREGGGGEILMGDNIIDLKWKRMYHWKLWITVGNGNEEYVWSNNNFFQIGFLPVYTTKSAGLSNNSSLIVYANSVNLIDVYLDTETNLIHAMYLNQVECDALQTTISAGLLANFQYKFAMQMYVKRYTIKLLQFQAIDKCIYNDEKQYLDINQLECFPPICEKIDLLADRYCGDTKSLCYKQTLLTTMQCNHRHIPMVSILECDFPLIRDPDDQCLDIFIQQLLCVAIACYHRKKFHDACLIFDKLSLNVLKHLNIETIAIIALSYHGLKHYEKAMIYYQLLLKTHELVSRWSALELKGIWQDIRNDIFVNIGVLYNKLYNDNTNAIFYTKLALKYIGNDAFAYNNLGYYHYLLGDYEMSRKYLLLSLESYNGEYANGNMANVLYTMGQFEESIPYFMKTIDFPDQCFVNDPQVGIPFLINFAIVLCQYCKNYTRSLEICQKILQHPHFKKFKDKAKVCRLIAQNYSKSV